MSPSPPKVIACSLLHNTEIKKTLLNFSDPQPVPEQSLFNGNMMDVTRRLTESIISQVRRQDVIQLEMRGERLKNSVLVMLNSI